MLESIFQSPILSAPLAQAQGLVAPSIPFWQTGWFVFLLLIAAVALGIFLAKTITNGLKVPEYNGRMAIVLVALFVASLMLWAKWPPKLGVDLRGGINMIGSLNLDAFLDENNSGTPPKAKDIIPALIQRVNPSGTKEIMIRPLGDDKIEVTIPSVDPQEADDIWNRLVKAGKLEFRILANPVDFPSQVSMARAMAADGGRGRKVVERDENGSVVLDKNGNANTVAVWVALARAIPEGPSNPGDIHPIKFVPSRSNIIRDKSSGTIIESNQLQAIISSLSRDPDLQGRDFAFRMNEIGVRVPQILVIQPEEEQNVEGKHLSQVQSTTDKRGRAAVSFSTTADGSSRMGMLTRLNIEQPMGIVLDGQLHSAPNINSAIFSNGVIEGNFTQEEVNELIINLESGKLDVALNKSPISRDFIESTLGQELKNKGIWAIACSLGLVLVFMLVYYRFAGIVATIALLLNLVLILALVMAINQPLTLTGLAGLVLTVGMSVDANVLIFERIREELDRGAALRMAIRNGFDKATTTIVDANVTTLITAIVLYVIGTEQIKGFSVTLILGILMSMFTAIFVARLIFDICERKRWLTKLNMTRILERKKWNFLDKVGFTGLVSAGLIIAGLIGMYSLGAKILNHDLRGGSTVRMVFNDEQSKKDIVAKLDAGAGTEDFIHQGEEIEFTVSALGDDKKTFKVDSNLPAWEGRGSDVPEFKQLPQLLQEQFEGQLKLHHVEIQGVELSDASGLPRSLRRNKFSIPLNFANMTVGSVGMVTYQEAPVVEAVESAAQAVAGAVEAAVQEAPAVVPAVQVPATPAVQTPAVQTPVVEAPAVETPVVQTPAVQTPAVQAPAAQTPAAVQTPAVQTPAVQAPMVETPKVQTPVVEVPATPAVQTPAVQTPAVQTPVVETPVVEAPVVEAPAVEVPSTPAVQTPPVQTPVVEAPVVETPAVEVPSTPAVEMPTTPAATTPAVETPIQTPADTTTTDDLSTGGLTTTPGVESTTPETSSTGSGSTIGSPQDLLPGGDFQGSGGVAGANGAITNLRSDEKRVTRSMKVTPAISGKSLRNLIKEASETASLGLEEDQIIVDSKDTLEDESPLSTISEDWDVTMEVSNESEADRILTVWGKKFNQQPYFPTTSKVGGQIAGQTQLQALAAIIASLLGIIAYVWIRFQNVAFGLAAVIALVHDVLIVLGAIALSHWLAGVLGILGVTKFKISLEIVAALLTVIGYSLNDTIVVFDRIREVRGKRTEITAEMINSSISQTLSRTILTSITTFIVVFILYWFGGEAIHGFAFALVIGVIVGTYSSIFVASPSLLWLMNTVGLNPGVVDPAVE